MATEADAREEGNKQWEFSVPATSTLVSALQSFGNLANGINALNDQNRTPLHYAVGNGFTEIAEILLKYTMSEDPKKEYYQRAGALAAARGDLATVKLLISPAKRTSGHRFLRAACRAGQSLVVEYLLRNELVSPDGDGSLGSAPIFLAASNGYNEIVRALLRYKAAANIEGHSRKSPLHHAAETGRYHIALMLLQHRANANARDIKRNTPLHSAAKAGQVRDIKLLLECGADIEARSHTKETALHLAVKNAESVEALLKAGADRGAADMLGQTPLHMATFQKCYKSVDLLISEATIDARDGQGRPLLCLAIENDDLEMVNTLYKDRHNLRDSQEPVLQWAVEFAALKVLRFLLDRSSESINKPDNYGRRLLHKAAEKESLDVLTLLLDSGADVNVSDGLLRRTPLHNAANADSAQIAQKLVESGAKINDADLDGHTPLHLAADLNNVKVLAVLLKACPVLDVRDRRQRTPLHMAVHSANADAVGILLDKNANPDLADSTGWSPLHVATGNPKITMMLIAHNANVNIQEQSGLKTPLHLATTREECSTAVAKLLLENGASLNQADSSGDTALHQAIEIFNGSVVQLMLDMGADFKIKGRDGLSCLGLASGYGLPLILKMLLAVGKSSASGTDWDFSDLVAAYWQAIKQQRIKTFQALVEKERRLLDELSGEGFTSLEICLSNEIQYGDGELIAICLLELGADPFKRSLANHKSGFELGIITRRKLKEKFMDACLERVSKDLSNTLDLGFQELRIITELDKPLWDKSELWDKLKPLRDAASTEIDHDGWSLDILSTSLQIEYLCS